jgi:cobalt-zinc-cadmium efflux system membrane fusion protein
MGTTTVKERPDTAEQHLASTAALAPPEPDGPAHRNAHQKRSKRAAFLAVAIGIAIVAMLMAVRLLRKPPALSPPVATAETTADSGTVFVEPSQLQSIKLAAAAPQTFRAEKVATGKIAFNEELMTPVYSPYAGRILRLLAKPGDAIKTGAPLFEIDTPDLVQAESDLINGGIALAKSNAALDLARRGEDRAHRLYLNKAIALRDWEQAEADLKNAERDVRSAEATLAAARARLRVFGKTDEEIAGIETTHQVDRVARVASPIAGTITARKVGPGQFVRPDSPDPLFTVANLSTVWILAEVYESDAPLLKVGQPVAVRVNAYPDEAFTARVTYISPSVDATTHRVSVRGVIENRGQRLKPDMFASFHITTGAETQALAVPAGAIVRDGDKTAVWVTGDGTHFTRREVTVGTEQNGFVQIVNGLLQGERVVSEGGLFISNVASS